MTLAIMIYIYRERTKERGKERKNERDKSNTGDNQVNVGLMRGLPRAGYENSQGDTINMRVLVVVDVR